MASITIQDIEPAVLEALERAAKQHGTTPEQEAHKLLLLGSAQLRREQAPASKPSFMEQVASWRTQVGDVELDDLVDELERSRDRSIVRTPEAP